MTVPPETASPELEALAVGVSKRTGVYLELVRRVLGDLSRRGALAGVPTGGT